MTRVETEISADMDALARRAAALVLDILQTSRGDARVCLSGGSTPKRLYEILAGPSFADRLPWERVHWFWGDERFVPPDHPDSNYRMARNAMLAGSPAPPSHIHPIATVGVTPEQAAIDYERTLKAQYGRDTLDPARPLFEVTLLGLGEDGHTASLFPGVAALEERQRWVAAVIGAKPEPRISLTLPALDASRHVLFLISGAAKRPVLRSLRRGVDLPAGRVRPAGTLHWLLDRDAAPPSGGDDAA